MYSISSSLAVGSSGLVIGGAPPKPASVITCACTLPPRCATVASQTWPSHVRPGMKMTGRPLPLTSTVNDVGLNVDAAPGVVLVLLTVEAVPPPHAAAVARAIEKRSVRTAAFYQMSDARG